MSKLELIRGLYGYNEWANERVLRAAARLGEENFSREQGASWGSIEANVAHLVAAQTIWLQRWQRETNVRPVVDEQKIAGMDRLQARFAESHAALRTFVEQLTEAELESVLDYRDSKGNPYSRPLWQLMAHVVNHGTQHRSETAMALTACEQSPGDIDYVYFELARAQAADRPSR